MTLQGFVLVDRETGEVRGGLNSIVCVYSRTAAERTLKEFTSAKNQTRWEIKPAKVEVDS
jgi:hypothetical protein